MWELKAGVLWSETQQKCETLSGKQTKNKSEGLGAWLKCKALNSNSSTTKSKTRPKRSLPDYPRALN
jgi:hypothetical protein